MYHSGVQEVVTINSLSCEVFPVSGRTGPGYMYERSIAHHAIRALILASVI